MREREPDKLNNGIWHIIFLLNMPTVAVVL